MSIWNERIHERRIEKGLTLAQVAEKLGVAEATAQRYECGSIKSIPYECMCAYGEILNCSPAYLMGWEDESTENTNNFITIGSRQFPMLAGTVNEQAEYSDKTGEYYLMPGNDINADFCIRAHDSSMINAGIHDGDLVFIKKQDTVKNGEIAAVTVNSSDSVLLKRVFRYVDKKMVILKSENPAYEDMIFTDNELSDFHILGKAVAFQSNVR